MSNSTPSSGAASRASTSTPKPRGGRRWYQFRLRTLLIVMTVLAIGMGAVSTKLSAARRQRIAADQLEALRARVAYDYEQPFVISCWGPGPQPEGPEWVNKWLGVDVCNDVGYVLFWNDNQVQPVDLQLLADFPQLHTLDLGNIPASPERTAQLVAHPHLTSVTLTDLTSEDLQAVSRLDNLEMLDVNGSELSNLSPLSQLKKLEMLYIKNLRIDDLAPLAELSALKHLGFRGLELSISNFRPLAHLTDLESLDVEETSISIKQVKELLAVLPECDITHPYTDEELAADSIAVRE